MEFVFVSHPDTIDHSSRIQERTMHTSTSSPVVKRFRQPTNLYEFRRVLGLLLEDVFDQPIERMGDQDVMWITLSRDPRESRADMLREFRVRIELIDEAQERIDQARASANRAASQAQVPEDGDELPF
jgi:hypothetical protein